MVLGSWSPKSTICPFRARKWPFQAPGTLRFKGQMANFEATNTVKQGKNAKRTNGTHFTRVLSDPDPTHSQQTSSVQNTPLHELGHCKDRRVYLGCFQKSAISCSLEKSHGPFQALSLSMHLALHCSPLTCLCVYLQRVGARNSRGAKGACGGQTPAIP